MGTDIHVFVERRLDSNGKWEYVPAPADGRTPGQHDEGDAHPYRYAPWEDQKVVNGYYMDHDESQIYMRGWFNDRNYELFARLADVRNGTGFGGCETGKPVTPIATPKGWPLDLSDEMYEEFRRMEHTPTWFLLEELQTEFEKIAGEELTRVGYVTGYDYQNLKENGIKPESWSGGISGHRIVSCDEAQYEAILNKSHRPTGLTSTWDASHETIALGKDIPIECFSTGENPRGLSDWQPPFKPDDEYKVYVQATWQTPATDSYLRWIDFMKELATYTTNPANLRVLIYFDS